MPKPFVNEVRVLDTPRGPARLVVHLYESGQVSLRAAPEKGEREDLVTLAVIRSIVDLVRARRVRHRTLSRRYREAGTAGFVDVVDAVDIYNPDAARAVLGDLKVLIAGTVH